MLSSRHSGRVEYSCLLANTFEFSSQILFLAIGNRRAAPDAWADAAALLKQSVVTGYKIGLCLLRKGKVSRICNTEFLAHELLGVAARLGQIKRDMDSVLFKQNLQLFALCDIFNRSNFCQVYG